MLPKERKKKKEKAYKKVENINPTKKESALSNQETFLNLSRAIYLICSFHVLFPLSTTRTLALSLPVACCRLPIPSIPDFTCIF